MRRSAIGRAMFAGAPLLASAAIATTATWAASSTTPNVGPPSAATGGVAQVRGTSAQLQGAVDPHGLRTTYFFKYGPTLAYGSATKPATLPAGPVKIKVGQPVTGLLPGYHYRLVATNSAGVREGRDRTYTTKAGRLKFQVPKRPGPTVFGTSFVLSGTLTGTGGANHRIALQSSPFPYLTPFAEVGLPAMTDAAGRFSFRVPNLTSSTQFRIGTLDPRPVYSPIVSEHVAVRVVLRVRASSRKGLVRLYGTVKPAEVGVRVSFQVRKAVRPGKSEKSTRFSSQFSTVVKRGTKTTSRFSVVESIRLGGRYRAFVQVLHRGPVVSGSSGTIVLHAAPASRPGARHKKH
jgi:hypothetical protein